VDLEAVVVEGILFVKVVGGLGLWWTPGGAYAHLSGNVHGHAG